LANILKKVLSWSKTIGPGLITAALVFGPSKMTITSRLGADYGYSMLWIVVVAIFFMAIFTSMSTRIGISTDKSLLETIREKWGKPSAILMGIGVFLVSTSFQAGNSIGVGIALGELYHTSPVPWILAFNILGISLLFLRRFYSVLEKTMMVLIVLMLLSFIATLFYAKPDLAGIASGFVPSFPANSFPLIVAFTASCFSIVGALYQSYLVQERRSQRTTAADDKKSGSLAGTILLGVMSAVVIICAAAVLHPKGIKVNSASDMAKALEPIFGRNASTFFLIGLFGAAFSSLIGNASVGGTLLADALGFGSKFGSVKVRYLIALVMIFGAFISIVFGKLPLELIIFAQSVTIFVVPFIGIAMYAVANDSTIMGLQTNSTFVKIFGALGLILLVGLAINNVETVFINNPLFK
jgi:manganese transport protein